MAANPDVSVLMAAYNERATIETALDRALAAELPGLTSELVVVDDGSTDGTSEILDAREWGGAAQLHRHERNAGKGAALRTALEHARGTYSVILDADLEYDPVDLPRLIDPLVQGKAQAVFGSRAFESHSAYGFWYVVGNKAVSMAANLLYNAWLSDIMTCLKAMPTETFRSLELRERGFAIEPEITARLLSSGTRIYEVPISYNARSREEGKKLTARDGLRALRTLLRCRI